MERLSQREALMAELIGSLLMQHLHEEEGIYDSAFVRINKEAMLFCVDIGIAELMAGSREDRTRFCEIRFKPDWEMILSKFLISLPLETTNG